MTVAGDCFGKSAVPGSAGNVGGVSATWQSASVGTNRYGERRYDDPVSISISVIDLEFGPEKTTRRADSGATEGMAAETVVSNGKIQLPHGSSVKPNDKLTIYGTDFMVVWINPKFDTQGCATNIEAGLTIWKTGF